MDLRTLGRYAEAVNRDQLALNTYWNLLQADQRVSRLDLAVLSHNTAIDLRELERYQEALDNDLVALEV